MPAGLCVCRRLGRRGLDGRALAALLEAAGASPAQAVAAGALFGPAQVAARLFDASMLERHHPLLSARLSLLAHPIGAALLLLGGSPMAMLFTVVHGAGQDILTIARGTVPLAIFGPDNYGYRLGLLGAPARIAQAAAPLAFALLLDRLGCDVLVITSAITLSALVALSLVRGKAATASA